MSRHAYSTKSLIRRGTMRYAMCAYIHTCGEKARASAIKTLPAFTSSNGTIKPEGAVYQINQAIDAGLIWAVDASTGRDIRRVRDVEALQGIVLVLTPIARLELETIRRQDKAEAKKAEKEATAPAPSRTLAPSMVPILPPGLDPMARTPTIRPGSMDFASCPSRIGPNLVAYKAHC